MNRQTMADTVTPVTVTSPSGTTRELTLTPAEPGVWRASAAGGRTRTMAGDRRHAEGADQCRPDQSEGILGGHVNDDMLKPLAQATGGDARRMVDGAQLDVPRIVPVRASSVFRGDGWMGVRMRDASVVSGVGVLPMFAGVIGLLLLLGAFAATWLREGR